MPQYVFTSPIRIRTDEENDWGQGGGVDLRNLPSSVVVSLSDALARERAEAVNLLTSVFGYTEEDLSERAASNGLEVGALELPEYIHEDSLKEAVRGIFVGVSDEGLARTTVTTARELTTAEEDALREFLSGQYSDGWGEGFEQEPFTRTPERLSACFWTADDFWINTERTT